MCMYCIIGVKSGEVCLDLVTKELFCGRESPTLFFSSFYAKEVNL